MTNQHLAPQRVHELVARCGSMESTSQHELLSALNTVLGFVVTVPTATTIGAAPTVNNPLTCLHGPILPGNHSDHYRPHHRQHQKQVREQPLQGRNPDTPRVEVSLPPTPTSEEKCHGSHHTTSSILGPSGPTKKHSAPGREFAPV